LRGGSPEFAVDDRVAAASAAGLAYPDRPLLRGLQKEIG
jgi:hypothetical protein